MSKGNVYEELQTATPLAPSATAPVHLIRGAFSAGVGSYLSIGTYSAPVDTNMYFPGALYIDTTYQRQCCNSASSITAAAVFTSVYSA